MAGPDLRPEVQATLTRAVRGGPLPSYDPATGWTFPGPHFRFRDSDGSGTKVDLKADEAAIRAIIAAGRAQGSGDALTGDAVTWSGAYKRPNIGSKREGAFSDSALQKRKNQKNTVKVERLEVAASGDMAWEFSYGTLDYDVEGSSHHVSFGQGILRVWKKVNGQWKIAALFVRPLDTPLASQP